MKTRDYKVYMELDTIVYDFVPVKIEPNSIVVERDMQLDENGELKTFEFNCRGGNYGNYWTSPEFPDHPGWKLVWIDSENKEPLFCMWCGEKMKMRYPGGDPENGPAERRCSKQNHTTVKEEVYDAWASRKLGEILSDVKDDLDTVLMYANPFVSSTEDLEDISKRLGVLAKEIDAKIEENDVQTLEWEKSVNKIDWEK